MADRGDSVTILPDGKLGLCEHYNRDHFIGDIRSGSLDEDMVRQFSLLREEIPECADCPLYPVCLRLQNCPCEICHRQRRDDLVQQEQQAMLEAWGKYLQRKEQT
jgi:radical SAM protein with 4Fe4S-binding SPASM domain